MATRKPKSSPRSRTADEKPATKSKSKSARSNAAASAKKTSAEKGPAGAVAAPRGPRASNKPAAASDPKPVKLLSGGNPQIAKGHGDAPVQAYIDAMPGWKRDVGQRLDALIARTVPGVRKAVKWNSPLYGVDGERWFLGVHCFAKYIKIAFFRGTALRPPPPVQSKVAGTRYFHIHEHDDLDETQLATWVTQASTLPGERM